jgi:hypothetical protein
MAALDGNAIEFYGLLEKPESNMNNFQDLPFEDIDLDLVDNNIEMFRLINNL